MNDFIFVQPALKLKPSVNKQFQTIQMGLTKNGFYLVEVILSLN